MKKQSTQTLSSSRIFSNNIYILKLLHKSAPLLLATSIMMAVFTATARFISNTYILRYALNSINEVRSFNEITIMIVSWLIARLLISLLSTIYHNYYFTVKMHKASCDIHQHVYQKACTVELACYEQPVFYDQLSKAIEECDLRIIAVVKNITDFIYRIISLSSNTILILAIDPVLILFVMIPLLMIPFERKFNLLTYKQDMELKSEARIKEYTQRTFYLADYAKEMRLLDMPELMILRFQEASKRSLQIIKKYGFSIALMRYIVEECNDVVTSLGVTLYSTWQTFVKGNMGYGDCLIIVNSIHNIAFSLTDSANLLSKFQSNGLYIENLRSFLEYIPTTVSGTTELPNSGDLVLKNVSFRYDGASQNTINNLSMRIGRNEKIAIVGHNGAGKTTLVKLLLRLYDGSGSISYGGINIKDFCVDDYRNMFSSVMQDFQIFALSLKDNVLLRRSDNDKDIEIAKNALRNAGLDEKVMHFEKGLNTIMTKEFDESGELLSGGERQKLALSHVFSQKNRFVILDEPSSALDPVAESEMFIRMMEACENCGVVFISHRLSAAAMADRVYLLENGNVIEEGTHTELMQLNGKYADMFRCQAQNYAEVQK